MSPDELFQQNLQALQKKSTEWVDKLRDTSCEETRFTVEDGKKSLPTLKSEDGDGTYYLHSLYDPLREAEQFINKEMTGIEKAKAIVLVGAGLGYLTEILLPRLTDEQRIILVEPELCMLKAALAVRPMQALLQSEKISWVIGHPATDSAKAVAALLTSNWIDKWHVLMAPAIARYHIDFSRDFIHLLGSQLNTAQAHIATKIAASKIILWNILQNLRHSRQAPGVVHFQDKWRNRPLVLVAAGPSLDKQLATLREYQDRVLIIAVGQAWRSLRQAGIEPHIVASVDPHQGNLPHFVDMPNQHSWLLTDGACYPEIVDTFQGPRIFSYSIGSLDKALEPLQGRRGVLGTGGSVANNLFSFAVMTGASPIILIGQDLAYTGGVTHASGNVYRQALDEEAYKNDINLRKVPGYYGDQVITNVQMDAYRYWFENSIARLGDIEVINATEGGALIRGAVNRPFATALADCAEVVPLAWEAIWPNEDEFAVIEDRLFAKQLAQLERDINKIERLSIDTVNLARKLQNDRLLEKERQRLIKKLAKNQKDYEASSASARDLLGMVLGQETFVAQNVTADANHELAEYGRIAEAMHSHIVQACRLLKQMLKQTTQPL